MRARVQNLLSGRGKKTRKMTGPTASMKTTARETKTDEEELVWPNP
jgi:hypothetical protein